MTFNDIVWFTDEQAYEQGFIGSTGAEIRGDNDFVEWSDIDILNLWFARLAEERIGKKGLLIDPYSSTLSMSVSAEDLREFLSDCEALLSAYQVVGNEEFVPIRFTSRGDDRYDNLYDEVSYDDIFAVYDEVSCLLDESPETSFAYASDHEDYCGEETDCVEDDLGVSSFTHPDGTTDYTLVITLTHSQIKEHLGEVKGGMSHAYDFVAGIYRAIADEDLNEELRYFSQLFAEKYGYAYDD